MLKLHQTLKNAFPQSFQEVAKHESKALNGNIHVDDTWVTFIFQEGAKLEHSTEGVLVEDVLHFTKHYIKHMNGSLHSKYNDEAIKHLQLALNALDERTADRQERGVEGTSKA